MIIANKRNEYMHKRLFLVVLLFQFFLVQAYKEKNGERRSAEIGAQPAPHVRARYPRNFLGGAAARNSKKFASSQNLSESDSDSEAEESVAVCCSVLSALCCNTTKKTQKSKQKND